MKKLLWVLFPILLLSAIIFSGCTNRENNQKHTGYTGLKIGLDKQLALKIGDVVLQSTFGAEVLKDTQITVEEIKKENVYIVTRKLKANEDGGWLGGEYHVSISKDNGEIKRIWGDK